jgi:hypothetical protein
MDFIFATKLSENLQSSVIDELLVKSLVTMPNNLSIDKFQELCEITSRATTKELLTYLIGLGIGHLSKDSVSFSEKDKLDTILLVMKQGCDPEHLSKKLRWIDFELFTSLLIKSAGYTFERNVVFNKPRIQIDVIGFYHKIALLIDCKHWMKIYDFNVSRFSLYQIRRARIFLDKRKEIEAVIPIIVTLHESQCSFFDKIPIVPISRFMQFLLNFPFYLDKLELIQRQ